MKVAGTVHTRNRHQLVCVARQPRDYTRNDLAPSTPERDDMTFPKTHSFPVVLDLFPGLRRSVSVRKPSARFNDYISAVYKKYYIIVRNLVSNLLYNTKLI